MKGYKSGEDFVDSFYQELINSQEVKKAVLRCNGKPLSRENSIRYYMDRLELAHSSSRKIKLLKILYYEKYIIKHLPQSYIDFKCRIAREQGFGNVSFNEDALSSELERVKQAQRDSLDKWLLYLNDLNNCFPMWFRYYVFQGVLRLGKFSKKSSKFGRRSKNSVYPFAELNKDALNNVYSLLIRMINNGDISLEEKKLLLSGTSFSKLYSYYFKESLFDDLEKIDGQWIKYDQGDNYIELWESLQGKNTGWCIVSESICRDYVRRGDFHVFYTNDENGNPTMPRIAIRMIGHDEIREIRGIDFEQNLEPEMIPILDSYLSENFSSIEVSKYKIRVHDMNLICEIERKNNNEEELSLEEILFLYEIERPIQSFSWERDPRIDEIKKSRDIQTDLGRFSLEFLKEKILSNYNLFKYFSPSMDGYEALFLELLKEDNNIVYLVPKDFRFSNSDIAAEAVSINGCSLKFLSPTLSNSYELALEKIYEDASFLKYVPVDLPNYERLVLEALKINGSSLSYISREFRFKDLNVILEALNFDRSLMRAVSSELFDNNEVAAVYDGYFSQEKSTIAGLKK